MSRVVVVGATGHIGTYLVPRLVRGGHEVFAVSRGGRGPYQASPEWDAVTPVRADREAEDAGGTFGDRIAALRPDVVIDLICFTGASARQLVDALRPSRPLLVHCGTIWVHGRALRVPVTEDEPRTAFGGYGTGKAEIEALLHQETRAGGVPAVVRLPCPIMDLASCITCTPMTWRRRSSVRCRGLRRSGPASMSLLSRR